jgi:DNA-binding transcriptional regulator YdaS (Cro superfamily)
MSNTTIPKAAKSVRYTDTQKKEVTDFILSYNTANGRGGQSKAAEKFKISQITIAGWLKSAGASAPKAAAKVKTPTAAKAPKAAKAPNPVKAAKKPKAAKAAKAAKATKPSDKVKVGKRYTTEQKAEITDFVAAYNAANGRGGQSKAAEKFKVSPLTVMAWLKGSGGKVTVKKSTSKVAKSPTATVSSAFDAKLASLLALSKEISKTEAALVQMNEKFKKMKAAL